MLDKGAPVSWKYRDNHGILRSLTGVLTRDHGTKITFRSDGGQPGFPAGKLITVRKVEVTVGPYRNSGLNKWVKASAIRIRKVGGKVLVDIKRVAGR